MSAAIAIPPNTDLNLVGAQSDIPRSEYQLFLSDNIEKAPLCIGINELDQTRELFTLGNISTIKGKAKSRKSFLCSLLLSASLSQQSLYDGFFEIPDNAKGALLVDTEQGRYHVQRLAKRVPRLLTREPNNFFIYALRTADTPTRIQELENAIKRHNQDISFMIIDGIADLVFDINDRAECVEVVTKLMQWSTDYNIHICTVLHENKTGTDARGHLGTEMVNKSETVLKIEKDSRDPKKQSIVKGEYTRGFGFDDFAFYVDEDGLPRMQHETAFRETHDTSSRKLDHLSFEPKEHMTALKKYVKPDEEYTRTEIHSKVTNCFAEIGHKFGRDKIDKFLQWYLDNGYFKLKYEQKRHPKQRYLFVGHELKFNGWSWDDIHNL